MVERQVGGRVELEVLELEHLGLPVFVELLEDPIVAGVADVEVAAVLAVHTERVGIAQLVPAVALALVPDHALGAEEVLVQPHDLVVLLVQNLVEALLGLHHLARLLD